MKAVEEVFDFIVVGSGGGSMCAALVLRSAGRSVLILEKTNLVGGTTARSGGVMWIPNNRFMAAAGVEDSYEKASTYLDATVGQSVDAPGASAVRRETYLRQAPKMVDFLVSQGVKLRRIANWPDYYDERPGSSTPGRTVIAELFDVNQLGPWRDRLRRNDVTLPGRMDELFSASTMKQSWRGKLSAAKIGLRSVVAGLTGRRLATAGEALQGRMLQAALKAGAEIRTNAPVGGLILEGGAVKGVLVGDGAAAKPIGARLGVLINAGGFAQNQEMRDRFIPGTSVAWTAAGPGDTGEMLLELMRIGAATAQLDERVGNQMAIPPGRENTGDGVSLGGVGSQNHFTKPHSIIVDQSGVRYMNEGGSYSQFCKNMLERHATTPAVPSWWIVDQQYMDAYMFCGAMPGSKPPQAWYDAGFLKRADSVQDLAKALGIEPDTLQATIERFNVDARAGRDTLFGRGDRAYDRWLGDESHRPSATLGTIERGPFYAAPVVPGDVGTFGGVVTDEHARVLREDGVAIPGLYATGNTTASVMGRVYPGAGASIGPSFTWGYVAARHAAGLSAPAP